MSLTYKQLVELFKLREKKTIALKKLNKLKPKRKYRNEINKLNKDITLGVEATKELIKKNLALVDFIITTRYSRVKIDFEDLQQEGRFGLIKAVETFDYKLGYRFSTHAHYYIRNAINLSISSFQNLGISSYDLRNLSLINRYETNYIVMNGKNPNLKEISKNTKLSVKQIIELKNLPRLISLETPVGSEEDGLTLIDIIEDKTILPPDKLFDLKLEHQELNKAINTLKTIEKQVIELRYGFTGKIHTLKEVGEIVNLSTERVRQIQLEAINNLKQYYLQNNLK